MSKPIRSFIAFDIEEERVIQKLVQAQRELVLTQAHLKIVRPENIHVTIRFLGNISEGIVDKIYEKMKEIAWKPFEFQIQGLGVFPHLRYPRVVWAGIRQGAEQLRTIFSRLEPNLRKLGFAPDPKGFSPHITIARVKSGRNKAELAKKILELTEYEFGMVKAHCLRLKQSTLTPNGPVYSTLREYCPQE
jgi:2'-5' RNA ligase